MPKEDYALAETKSLVRDLRPGRMGLNAMMMWGGSGSGSGRGDGGPKRWGERWWSKYV